MSKNALNSILEITQDDFLKVLYEHRNNEGGIITGQFKEKVTPFQVKVEEEKKTLINFRKDNLNNPSKIEKIKIKLQELLDSYSDLHGLYQEQYYNTGISDGVKLMLQCFK